MMHLKEDFAFCESKLVGQASQDLRWTVELFHELSNSLRCPLSRRKPPLENNQPCPLSSFTAAVAAHVIQGDGEGQTPLLFEPELISHLLNFRWKCAWRNI